jgi:hypothetical protein
MNNENYLEENIAYTVVEDENKVVESGTISGSSSHSDFDLDEFMKDFDYEYIKQTTTNTVCDNEETVNDLIFAEISNYDLNYTLKQLVTISNYYEISCNKKKWKKLDYIKAILEFEHNLENYETVGRRKQMWFYMEELKNDKFMKQFILFL